jgi:hypothetical protein
VARRRSGGGPAAEPDGAPTVIAVEVDYGYSSILVDRSPGVLGVREVDPTALGLPPDLVRRLGEWLARWDALSRYWTGAEPEPDWVRGDSEVLGREMVTLAYDVQHALGPDVEVRLGAGAVHDRRGP